MVGVPEFEGLVEEPFKVCFEKGHIVKISEGKDARKLRNLLDTLGDQARTFAELGVNSSHKIPKILLGTQTDNAIAGHVHVGPGRNDRVGGKRLRMPIWTCS